jgi:hypothetical protein
LHDVSGAVEVRAYEWALDQLFDMILRALDQLLDMILRRTGVPASRLVWLSITPRLASSRPAPASGWTP